LFHPELPSVVQQLAKHFRKADKNEDGILTRAELIHYMRQCPDMKALLGFAPHQPIGDAEREAFEAVYKLMDEDDDGKITEEELVAYFTTFPLVVLLNKIGCADRFIKPAAKKILDEGFETEADLLEMFAAHGGAPSFGARLVDTWKLPEQIATKLFAHFTSEVTPTKKQRT